MVCTCKIFIMHVERLNEDVGGDQYQGGGCGLVEVGGACVHVVCVQVS